MKAVSQDAGIFVDYYTLLTGSFRSLQFLDYVLIIARKHFKKNHSK
jgi:hypothetical protein